MNHALIMDYFGTIASPARVDALLVPRTVAGTADSFRAKYIEAAGRVLEEMLAGDAGTVAEVQNTFYPGVQELFETARAAGLDTLVYSSGNPAFIRKGLECIGVQTEVKGPGDVGPKRETTSYEKLREAYRGTIYVTDDVKEADAARRGGISYVIRVNPEAPDFSEVYKAITALQSAETPARMAPE